MTSRSLNAARLLGRPIDLHDVIAEVERTTGVPSALILGRSRRKPIVQARHLAIHWSRRYAQASVRRIARILGRDRSTVLYALRRT